MKPHASSRIIEGASEHSPIYLNDNRDFRHTRTLLAVFQLHISWVLRYCSNEKYLWGRPKARTPVQKVSTWSFRLEVLHRRLEVGVNSGVKAGVWPGEKPLQFSQKFCWLSLPYETHQQLRVCVPLPGSKLSYESYHHWGRKDVILLDTADLVILTVQVFWLLQRMQRCMYAVPDIHITSSTAAQSKVLIQAY